MLVTPVFFVHAATKSTKVTKIINPIKILLVPGHDNETVGSQYKYLKETDANLAVATRIFSILKKDKRFKVYITRDNSGAVPGEYTKEFADYFVNNKDAILTFKENAKKQAQEKVDSGVFIQKDNVFHASVSPNVALRLYGINKWANDNKMDAVIHVHFNDNPRPNRIKPGTYKGFNIYMPDPQLANWKESGQLAANIYVQLHKKYITSTYPPEAGGMVQDQKLIALGAKDTLNASVRSVLIEYNYIYEKRLRTQSTRLLAYKNMSNLTATGIKNYFFNK